MNHLLPARTLMLLSAFSFATSGALGQGCPDPQFGETDYNAGDAPRAVAIGDLDNDGDLDLAIANSWTTSGIIYHGTEGVHVLLNQGDGTYAPRQFHAAGVAPQSIALGDLDGDGDLDMVTAELGQYGNSWMNYGVNVLLNDGDGGFSPATLHPLDPGYVEPRSAVLGDLDHDGDLDVVVTVGYSSYLHSEIAVMLNDGDGTLGPPQYFPTGYGPFCVALGDLNGDGDLDAVTANYTSNTVTHLYGDGSGGFGPALYSGGGDQPRWVTLADLNDDGSLDMAIANHDGMIVRLDGGASVFYPVGLRPSCIAAGDVDDDGDLDLAVTNVLSDNVSLLRNNGSGQFPQESFFWTGNAAHGVAIGDLDATGFADLVVANLSDDTATVLLNDCAMPGCVADLDLDGVVGSSDLAALLAAWGPAEGDPADLTGDGVVGADDLATLLSNWGSCADA